MDEVSQVVAVAAGVALARGPAVDSACSGAPPEDNCIKIGLPGKLILSKRKGLREVLFL